MRCTVLLLLAAACTECAQLPCDRLTMAVCNSTATCIWNAPWKPGACVYDPCTPALSTSTACQAVVAAVTPCPKPLPEPDYCLFSPCVWNTRCERRPCLHKDQVACDAETGCKWMPPPSGVPAGPVQAVVDVCRRDGCAPLDVFACVQNPRCSHDPVKGCLLSGCALHANEATCGRNRPCRWDNAAGQCENHRCDLEKDRTLCMGDSECMWDGGLDESCVPKTCNKYNSPGDKFGCKADPDCWWLYHVSHSHCTDPKFRECPDQDVAFMLDGSGSTRNTFGSHPHGFYGMLAIMRAWVRMLPLTGDDYTRATYPENANTSEFRVTFIQFSKANALPSELHPTNCAVGACTSGQLSGRLDELEGDLTWHENNYQGLWTYIHGALKDVADHTFFAPSGAWWLWSRRRVVIILTDGGLTDFDGDSCCDSAMGCLNERCVDTTTFDVSFPDKIKEAQDSLSSERVVVYAVAIRRWPVHNAQDTAAEQKYKAIVSNPPDDHFVSIMLDELPDKVLNTLCDPNSKFGKGLNLPAGCNGNADKATCEASDVCAWDAEQTPKCFEDPCFPLWDEVTCNSDAFCLWGSHVCTIKYPGGFSDSQASCNDPFVWAPIWSSVTRCELDLCQSRVHTQELSCVAQTVTMPAPCTPPFDKPDYCKLPLCEFDKMSATCTTQKCRHMDQTRCEKETNCVWTPVTPTPDQPVAQVGQCSPPVCTTLPHMCSAGFQLKPAASTTVCPGIPSVCDDATCCAADKPCNTHTCTSGSQLKTAASSITCTATPCTDTTCCDVLCSTHTCSAGFQLKPTPAAIVCTGTPSVCDDATCCVADPLCSTHTCTSGSQLKASASSITHPACTGTPCTDATCCDVLCSTHTCSAGFQLKPTPAAIVCTGTPSVCDDATCCVADPLCSTHTCTSGSQLKASASSITCTDTPSVCTDATCCNVLCSTHTCSAGFQLKPTPAAIVCTGTPSVCDDAMCCVALCDAHTCTSGSQLKTAASSITCTPCTDATCCNVLCSTHTCSAGFQLKPTPAAIVCTGTPSVCDDATCCVTDPLCNTHTCTSGSQLKASASSITCTGTPSVCTDATCCEKLCSTYTCPETFLDKPSKATLPCGNTPPVCDDATCCDVEFVCAEHTCGTGFVGNAGERNTSCGARPCADETCCLGAVPVSTFVPADEQTTARLVGGTTSGGIAVVSAVGGVTGASGLSKGGARVARNMVYLSMMDCPRSGVEEVGFVLSPTRLSLGSGDLRELRGAIVGNLALLALVVALLVGIAALQRGRFLVSLAGMPLAVPMLLLELLWMPVVQGGFALVMYSESEAAGGAAVLTCAVLFLVGTGRLTRKAKAQCTFVHNKRKKGLVWFVTAAGSWESTDGLSRPSVDVLASVFDGFYPAHCLYFVVQLVSMTALAGLAAWNPKTIVYCSLRAGMLTVLPIGWAAVLLKDLPYLRPIENAVEILITLCEFVFGILAALAVGDQNQGLYDAAAVLGVVMAYIMMVKAAVDLCTLVYQLREEYTNHGTVCGPPVRMCCGDGCPKCASLGGLKVCFSEPMLALHEARDSLGASESETSIHLQAVVPPSAQYCVACEYDGNTYVL